MVKDKVTLVPEGYFRAVDKQLQGSFIEVTYPLNHYINESRQLVTNQEIDNSEIGRETVRGTSIDKKCNIYLPAGYNQESKETRYNVLYLLHGVGGNRYEWPCGSGNVDDHHVICNILDNLIANGDCEPLIVVFPDGRSAHDWTDTSFNPDGTNMLGFYYFDYELRYDLIPYIESKYPTYSDINNITPEGIIYNQQHRAIAGLSMGGMQVLNLVLGGYRFDSAKHTGNDSKWKNGLDQTVPTKGMLDLFAYAGAFSNAPTSSSGKVLSANVAASLHKLDLLYLTCGDADGVAYHEGYKIAIEGFVEGALDQLGDYYEIVMKDGAHDFFVWNNGAYNFLRLIFDNELIRNEAIQNKILRCEDKSIRYYRTI